MKILIIGGTGPTGKELIRQALVQNHEVSVLVRDPSKLNASADKLKIITGNVLDVDVLKQAMTEAESVISVIGVGQSLKSNNLISNAVDKIIPAMNDAGVKRIIFLSAFGVGETIAQASWIQKIAFRLFLRDIYADKEIGSAKLQNSNLDWTIVSPVKLTNGTYTGNYKAAERVKMKGFPSISRADVADFLLKQLGDNSFVRKEVIVMD